MVIGDDPNDGDLQRLRFWVDDGQDGFDPNDLMLTTTTVDDNWSAGRVGLYRRDGYAVTHQLDDVNVWLDNDDDGILDAADDVQIDDDFNSGSISVSYDNNGNLTDDGVHRYVYDAWNRLVKVNRYADSDTTTVATYAYLPDNRRASKVVTNSGVEETDNDGGNTTLHFYYCGTGLQPVNWTICETRNGSNQALRQWVWGIRYVDEVLFMDVNGDPTESNDCNPDAQAGESTYDRRYFYHQDRNWNVVAITEYDDGVGTDGRIVERYAYTPYGEFIVLKGDTGSGELGNVLPVSTVGNPFAHQGLYFDHEKGRYENRGGELNPVLCAAAQGNPPGGTRSGDYCQIQLVCWEYTLGMFHCETHVVGSENGENGMGQCTCGFHDCPDGIWCMSCYCLGCEWLEGEPGKPPGAIVTETRIGPESLCQCVKDTCKSFPRTKCYEGIASNSNSAAHCISTHCNLNFADPRHHPDIWRAPGWWDGHECPAGL